MKKRKKNKKKIGDEEHSSENILLGNRCNNYNYIYQHGFKKMKQSCP